MRLLQIYNGSGLELCATIIRFVYDIYMQHTTRISPLLKSVAPINCPVLISNCNRAPLKSVSETLALAVCVCVCVCVGGGGGGGGGGGISNRTEFSCHVPSLIVFLRA